MPVVTVLNRPANVVNLFETSQGAPAPMPDTSRRIVPSQPSSRPPPADRPEIELDPNLMRGLHRWTGATLSDGRVILELLLGAPGEELEPVQIVLDRPVVDELGQDLRELATMLHLDLR